MNRFIKCSSEERNSVLQCAWNLCPGHNWSSLTKRAARAFVISLCHVWMRGKVFLPFSLGKEGKSERLSFPCESTFHSFSSIFTVVYCNAHVYDASITF